MEILVCVKQVPAGKTFEFDVETKKLVREGVNGIINPSDTYALEAALKLKDTLGARVTVVSMGPFSAVNMLQRCIAYGADRAFLANDEAFAGSDTLATGYVLSKLIQKTGKYDIILCGSKSTDGDTAQIGPQIAERLEIPEISFAYLFKPNNTSVLAMREGVGVNEKVSCPMPVLLTISSKASPLRKMVGNEKELMKLAQVTVYHAQDLEVDMKCCGKNGSPTQVESIFQPPVEKSGLMIEEGTAEKNVCKLMDILKEKHLIGWRE